MIKQKKFDIEDSNIALLGSDLDKKVKLEAAQTEEAWKEAGKELGIQIWRIEKFQVVAWPKEQYGKFYDGDSYIILRTYKKSEDAQKFSWDVHFWIGNESSQDEYGTAAYKTVELDDYLGGDPVQHREIQGYESPLFLTYFKQIEFLSGGMESGFRKVKATEYKPRLLHVKGKKNVVVREVPIEIDSMNKGDVFILDTGMILYQLNGSQAGPMERNKGAQLCRAIDDERGGQPEVFVFEENDRDANSRKFWQFFGGRKPLPKAIPDTEQKHSKKLFKLSDETGELKFEEVSPIKLSTLDTNDAFILDAGFEVFVWIGKGASKAERQKGLGFATDYLYKNNRPKQLPISRIMEGAENEVFIAAFQ